MRSDLDYFTHANYFLGALAKMDRRIAKNDDIIRSTDLRSFIARMKAKRVLP